MKKIVFSWSRDDNLWNNPCRYKNRNSLCCNYPITLQTQREGIWHSSFVQLCVAIERIFILSWIWSTWRVCIDLHHVLCKYKFWTELGLSGPAFSTPIKLILWLFTHSELKVYNCQQKSGKPVVWSDFILTLDSVQTVFGFFKCLVRLIETSTNSLLLLKITDDVLCKKSI